MNLLHCPQRCAGLAAAMMMQLVLMCASRRMVPRERAGGLGPSSASSMHMERKLMGGTLLQLEDAAKMKHISGAAESKSRTEQPCLHDL